MRATWLFGAWLLLLPPQDPPAPAGLVRISFTTPVGSVSTLGLILKAESNSGGQRGLVVAYPHYPKSHGVQAVLDPAAPTPRTQRIDAAGHLADGPVEFGWIPESPGLAAMEAPKDPAPKEGDEVLVLGSVRAAGKLARAAAGGLRVEFGMEAGVDGVALDAAGRPAGVCVQTPDGLGVWRFLPGATLLRFLEGGGPPVLRAMSVEELPNAVRVHTVLEHADPRGLAGNREFLVGNSTPAPGVVNDSSLWSGVSWTLARDPEADADLDVQAVLKTRDGRSIPTLPLKVRVESRKTVGRRFESPVPEDISWPVHRARGGAGMLQCVPMTGSLRPGPRPGEAYLVDPGRLSVVEVPAFRQVRSLILPRAAVAFRPTKAGLVVVLDQTPELWVLHPVTLEVRRKIIVKYAVLGTHPEQPLAVLGCDGREPLDLLDLDKGAVVRSIPYGKLVQAAKGKARIHGEARADGAVHDPVLAPDGKFLLHHNGTSIVRVSLKDKAEAIEEVGPPSGPPGGGLELDPSGKYVVIPRSGSPDVRVYSTRNLQKPQHVFEGRGFVGFDAIDGSIWLRAPDPDKTRYRLEACNVGGARTRRTAPIPFPAPDQGSVLRDPFGHFWFSGSLGGIRECPIE